MRTPHSPLRPWPRAGLPALAALLFLIDTAAASHIGDDLATDQQAVQANDQLLGALRQYEKLPASARAAREAALVESARARRDRLLHLLEHNPQLAALRLLPPGLRERLPASARAYAEQPDVPLAGRVYASVADDFERGVSRKEFKFMPEGARTALTLHLSDPAAGERDLLGWSGRAVRLRGTLIDGHLLLHKRGDVQLVAADATTTTATATSGSGNVTPAMTPQITGDRKTLTILANFSDATLACAAGDVANRVFGSTGSTVNTIYQESSRSAVGFSGTTAGPFTIPYASTASCDYAGWSAALDSAAKSAGVDLTQFQHISYVTPRNATCGWTGLAYMPGVRSWIQSCGSTGVYAHELGHNLSLHHAATPGAEYGDGSDAMGGARTVRSNGGNQVMAGWVPTGGVLDVFVGGSYAVAALQSSDAGAPQVLRLLKPDTQEFYYVSLRQNSGIDAALASSFVNALSIHRASGKLPTRTYLLQTIASGGSFVDSVNGLQIVNQGISGSVATVSVAFTGATCERKAPTVAVNPSTASAAPGGSVAYQASVTNQDSAACGSGSFALAQVLPDGFTGTLSAPTLALNPGAGASVSWTVKSAGTSADGTYTLDLNAVEAGTASGSTGHASYVVMRDTSAPALTVTSPAAGAVLSGTSATLAATASDASGVTAVEFQVDGALLARDTRAPYSASWSLRKASKGAHTVTVRAVDAAGNAATLQVPVTVQ